MAVEAIVSNITSAVAGAAAGSLPSLPLNITGFLPISGITGAEPLFLGLIFVIFIFAVRKVMGFIKNLFIIAVASAAFPFFLKAVGYSVPMNIPTFLSFIAFGIAAFAVFSVVKFIYKIFRRRK